MEEYTIGRLLKGIRREYGLTRDEFGIGIVSENVLMEIEQGEQYADKMTVDFLLARAGLSSLFYECYIEDAELELFDQRMELRCLVNDMLRILYTGNGMDEIQRMGELVRGKLKRYQKSWKRIGNRFVPDGTIHQFFSGIMEAYVLLAEDVAEPERDRSGKRLEQIWNTWHCLRRESCEELMKNKWPYLSAMELECLMLAACAYEAAGMHEKAKAMLYLVWEYRNHHEQEIEEQVKIYPYVARCLAQLEWQDGNERTAFTLCAEAMELLAEANSLKGELALMDFMLEHWCEDCGYVSDRSILEKQRECLMWLYQEYGGNPYGIYPMMTIENAVLASEAVKRGRLSLKMTQRELGEGIVEPETISRFETGKLRLRWKTTESLLARVGMKAQKIWMLIETDRPETVMRYWKIGTHLGAWRPSAAMEQLRSLRHELYMKSAINQQLIVLNEIIIKQQMYQIREDQKSAEKYEEILQMTLLDYPEVDWKRIFLTQTEASLLNAIVSDIEVDANGIRKINLYKKCLDNLENNKVNVKYSKQYIQFIKSNLASEIGNNGDHEQAISLSNELLRQELIQGCGKGMAGALYEIAWNLRELERREKTEKQLSLLFFHWSWYKALLERNREFVLFLQERRNQYEQSTRSV